MLCTAIIEKTSSRIWGVYEGKINRRNFGGAWGDPERTFHVEIEIPEEVPKFSRDKAIIPDGQGGAMLDPNWSPPVPEPTVEERLTARLEVLEARLKVLEAR